MTSNILIIDGNPARERATLSASLATAYADGARASGDYAEIITLSELDFDPILHEGYAKDQPLEPDLQALRERMVAVDHWVLIFPLWHGLPPALFKGFIERSITRGFAFEYDGPYPKALPVFKGKTVEMIITCGMPAFLYRWFSGAHASRALASIFRMCGMKVTRVSVLGRVALHDEKALARYANFVRRVKRLGAGI